MRASLAGTSPVMTSYVGSESVVNFCSPWKAEVERPWIPRFDEPFAFNFATPLVGST